MSRLPIFLSVVFVLRNQRAELEGILREAEAVVKAIVSDYELIVVDNASSDDSVLELKRLASASGLPNLQVFALTKEVDGDTASWVGVENALGDFVAILDPLTDAVGFLPQMLIQATEGADVVFAENTKKPTQRSSYRIANLVFDAAYKHFNGVSLTKEAPPYRVISKRVVNFILQHAQPAQSYRYLPATAGFARINLTYHEEPRLVQTKRLMDSIDRGTRMLVSTTRAPMRMVTLLSIFGAAANLIYSCYVLIIGFFKDNVAQGWVSMSLQQSGMFFLISLVLFVLCEYILQMASLSNEGPSHHVGQEFTSAKLTRREKLNVDEVLEAAASGRIKS